MKSAVVVTKAADKTTGYTVEVAIPWAGFPKAANKPPKPGDTWRMNFYAMKNNGGTSWSPILGKGNFHHGPRFGRLTFAAPAAGAGPVDAGAADAKAPVADAATAPSASGGTEPLRRIGPRGAPPIQRLAPPGAP